MSQLALLRYVRVGGSSGGGGTPTADFDGLRFRFSGNPGQDAGGVTFTLFSDGTWAAPIPHFSGTEDGNWFLPTTVGIGASYEAMFSYANGGNPNASTVNGAPTWTSLSSNISFDASVGGDFQAESWVVTCDIRDAGTHVVVATGTFEIIVILH